MITKEEYKKLIMDIKKYCFEGYSGSGLRYIGIPLEDLREILLDYIQEDDDV